MLNKVFSFLFLFCFYFFFVQLLFLKCRSFGSTGLSAQGVVEEEEKRAGGSSSRRRREEEVEEKNSLFVFASLLSLALFNLLFAAAIQLPCPP